MRYTNCQNAYICIGYLIQFLHKLQNMKSDIRCILHILQSLHSTDDFSCEVSDPLSWLSEHSLCLFVVHRCCIHTTREQKIRHLPCFEWMHGWKHNRGRDAACSSAIMPNNATRLLVVSFYEVLTRLCVLETHYCGWRKCDAALWFCCFYIQLYCRCSRGNQNNNQTEAWIMNKVVCFHRLPVLCTLLLILSCLVSSRVIQCLEFISLRKMFTESV